MIYDAQPTPQLSIFNFQLSDGVAVRTSILPTPAMIITQIGENPSSQMISADTMGIQTL